MLKAFLDVENSKAPPSYPEAAATLQVSVGAVKTLIHRLRKRSTALIREEVERTVENPATWTPRFMNFAKLSVVAEGRIVP